MAVLNVTPDSFSDGGRLSSLDQIVAEAEHALKNGAAILDVGGESTRPGSKAVDLQEELHRVIPAVGAIHAAHSRALISVDTRKSEVAGAALKEGARMVNDVSGLQFDPAMAEVVAAHKAWLVIMHSQGTPDVMQDNPHYPQGVVKEVREFLFRQAEKAIEAGVDRKKIILDPGFGFGKTVEHNLELLHAIDAIAKLGFPVMAGVSRKGFLTLGDSSITTEKREALTSASIALAVEKGADYVRVHDVETQAPVINLLNAKRKLEPETRY